MVPISRWLLLAVLLPLLAACSLAQVRQQSEQIEAIGRIEGRIVVESGEKGTPIAVLYMADEPGYRLIGFDAVSAEGRYSFPALPGRYFVAAFVDVNSDLEYQPEEHAAIFGRPDAIDVGPGERVSVPVLPITGPLRERPDGRAAASDDLRLPRMNLGRVVSLDDAMFSDESVSLGLWRPLDYIRQFGGGLFLLQPYDPGRIPVLFVHGISAGARDWRAAIEALDRARFQPWVLQYPSGTSLELVSEHLAWAVHELHRRYAFDRVLVAAHSMGGLVVRDFVRQLGRQYPEMLPRIAWVLTVNSPMGGMPSAASGVEHSPIVVPSWRDVATGSVFLRDLLEWDWPAAVPYYLVFSYRSGQGDDGVVPLESQLPPKLQAEARRLAGFNASHAGVLQEPEFVAWFQGLLGE